LVSDKLLIAEETAFLPDDEERQAFVPGELTIAQS